MPSTTSKGNYYKRKTKEMYEKLGYIVQLTEFTTSRPIGGGKMIYVKKDVFGSDGIAMNKDEIIFWNSKYFSGTNTLSNEKWGGTKEFNKYPFPPCVKLQLVIWESRKKPEIITVHNSLT